MRRFVLGEAFDRDALDLAMGARGWKLVNIVPGDARRPQQLVLSCAEGRAAMHLVEEGGTAIRYLVLEGADLEALEREVRDALPIEDPAAIVGRAALGQPPEGRARALRQLALAPPVACLDDVFEQVRAALEDAAPEVRRAGLEAAFFLEDPRYAPLLVRAAREEPDPALRAHAAALSAARASRGATP